MINNRAVLHCTLDNILTLQDRRPRPKQNIRILNYVIALNYCMKRKHAGPLMTFDISSFRSNFPKSAFVTTCVLTSSSYNRVLNFILIRSEIYWWHPARWPNSPIVYNIYIYVYVWDRYTVFTHRVNNRYLWYSNALYQKSFSITCLHYTSVIYL